MNNLNQLADRICKIAMVDIKQYKEYFEDWYKLMKKYDLSIILKAWEQISTEFDKWNGYFSLKVWVEKCDYLHYRAKSTEKPIPEHQTGKPLQSDGQVTNWKYNLNLYVTRQITRKQYLDNAIRYRQMTQEEALLQTDYWIKHNMNGYEYCRNVLDINL